MPSDFQSVPDVDYLRLFALSPDPILTAGELAEELPVSNQAVNSRLDRLEREGWIRSKKVGASAKVYWLSEAGREELASKLSVWRESPESE